MLVFLRNYNMYKIFKVVYYGKEQTHIIKDRGNNEFTSFPANLDNKDYLAIQKWIAEGGEVIDNGGNN